LQLGNRLAKEVVAARYSKERLTKDFMMLARDLQETLETSPRLLKRFLRKWSHNNFAIEVKSKDAELLPKAILAFTYYWVLTGTSLGLVALGAICWHKDVEPLMMGLSALGTACFIVAFYLLGTSLWNLSKYKR
jgi:hypothetical protein